MSVLVDYRRAAAERVVGVADLGAVGELLLQHLAEHVALEGLRESVLIGVSDRTPRAVVGDRKRGERLASVEALNAGHRPEVAAGVLRHNSVRVRHRDRHVEVIIANLRDVAERVADRNGEARPIVRNLRLTAPVVDGHDVARLVAGKARRERRGAIGREERDRDGLASLAVGKRGDGLDCALAMCSKRRFHEAALGVVREVAVVAEAVSDSRDVAALRVVAVRDEVLPLAVDYLADLAEICDVVAHEVVDGRLPAGEVGDREDAVLCVVAVARGAASPVAERKTAFVGVREVKVGDDARSTARLLEGDVLAHRTLRNRRKVVALVAEVDCVERSSLHRDELRTDGMRDLAVHGARQDLELAALVGKRCRHTRDSHGLRESAVVDKRDERRAVVRDCDEPPVGVIREVGAAASRRGHLRKAARGVCERPADEGLLSLDRPVAVGLGLARRDVRFPLGVGRVVAAALLRFLDDLDLHGVLGHFFVLREELDLLAPGRGPEHAVLIPRGGRLQLRGAPRKAERASLLGRRLVDELDWHRKLGRHARDAEAAAFDIAGLGERGAAREKRTA